MFSLDKILISVKRGALKKPLANKKLTAEVRSLVLIPRFTDEQCIINDRIYAMVGNSLSCYATANETTASFSNTILLTWTIV